MINLQETSVYWYSWFRVTWCWTRESRLLTALYGGCVRLVSAVEILCGAYELIKYIPDSSGLNVPGIVCTFVTEGYEAIHDVSLSRPAALAHTPTSRLHPGCR